MLGQDDYTLSRGGLNGDFNGNGEIDAGDLDVHSQYIKDQNLSGDVNNDGQVNVADRVSGSKAFRVLRWETPTSTAFLTVAILWRFSRSANTTKR